jgi:hypothetical protein
VYGKTIAWCSAWKRVMPTGTWLYGEDCEWKFEHINAGHSFHVLVDSIEALEDHSNNGEILGGLIRESWKSV